MAENTAYFSFDSCAPKDRKGKNEAELICRLNGFDPEKIPKKDPKKEKGHTCSEEVHTCSKEVTDNILYVRANNGKKNCRLRVFAVGVNDEAVRIEPEEGQVRVYIRKPDGDYSLESKERGNP
ncbi:uncharacterized protein LOC123554591 [Mercenaria mercenaria]|uniref:uncharacterized protein LOC123554591 n=1 Tax=Mercenaria mercenaria TaxID=6596 RepID=UPI00234E6432|nr:uncharacterized protein LOC123554591 [Mercenaria mercenaria]XP_045200775.2 uncharacterized protein LOC123554591 [Mercenaria mercenaria]XP_045200776.2 uncharacterized protein LOC123554591 [Mercenaria mercenaria]